ncbi:hypothetical protein BH20ACI1_BH20ACI1_00430 [soil metagenome]
MENEKEAEPKFPIDYEEKVARQEELVEKTVEAHRKNPTAENTLDLDRATDLLRHYSNALKEDPKLRAQSVAELAKRIALNRAVQQIPIEE